MWCYWQHATGLLPFLDKVACEITDRISRLLHIAISINDKCGVWEGTDMTAHTRSHTHSSLSLSRVPVDALEGM